MRKGKSLRHLFFAAALLMVACTKAPLSRQDAPPLPAANEAEAAGRLKQFFTWHGQAGARFTVVRVDNYQTAGNSYSLITYLNEAGEEHTMVQHSYYTDTGVQMFTNYRCEGSSCDCRIEIFETADGKLDVRCACTPCNMIIE